MVSPKKAKMIQKAKEKATKYIQKGNFEKAQGEYRILVKLVPDDLRFRMKYGECLARLNRKKDAIEEYKEVLDLYASKGFLIQAIAVGKVILQLDPEAEEINDQLADLNSRRGIGPPRKRVIRPALSLKGVEGPIPTALKKEEPEPAPEPAPAPEEEIAPAETLPDTIEEDAAPELVSEQETPGEELTMTPEEEEQVYAAQPAEEPVEEEEGAAIALDEAPEDMEEEEEAPVSSELPPLPETPLFSDLGVEEFKRVIEKFQIGNLPKGITVIKEGTKGDSFYIVAEGKVRVYKWSKNRKRKNTLTVLEEGSFFGEFAFLTNSVRSASVETQEECVLLRINRKDLEEIIQEHPHVREVMDEFYRKRVMDTLLQISPLFSSMDDVGRRDIMKRFESVTLDTGDVIIKEGEDGKALYLVKHGAIGISKTNPETGEEVQLAVLKEGDFFGEISLLQNTPTTANCTAMVPTDLFRLPQPAFQEMIMMNPYILETVSAAADERVKSTQKQLTAKAADRQTSGMV